MGFSSHWDCLHFCSLCAMRAMYLFCSDSHMCFHFSLSLTQCPQSLQVLTSGKKGFLLAPSTAHACDPEHPNVPHGALQFARPHS